MRWARNVARMVEKRNGFKILIEELEERGQFEDLDIDGRVILC
jgi:hypothetical protein